MPRVPPLRLPILCIMSKGSKLVNLRIAIDGAQSTGKTTLQAGLRSSLGSEFLFIPEASRIIAPRFGITEATHWEPFLKDKERLALFFEAERLWQLEQETDASDFIVDSSLFMIAAYRLLFGIKTEIAPFLSAVYDAILYCPVLDEPKEDGFRFLRGRAKADQTYRALIAQYFRGSFFRLPSGDSRLIAALTLIRRLQSERGSLAP